MSEIPPCGLASHHQGQLHKTGTINTEAAASAPQIGRFKKTSRNSDIILDCVLSQRPAVAGKNSLASVKDQIVGSARPGSSI